MAACNYTISKQAQLTLISSTYLYVHQQKLLVSLYSGKCCPAECSNSRFVSLYVCSFTLCRCSTYGLCPSPLPIPSLPSFLPFSASHSHPPSLPPLPPPLLLPSIVGVGGDGLFNELLNGLLFHAQYRAGVNLKRARFIPVQPTLRLGMVPCGHTNTLSHSILSSAHPVAAAVQVILGESPHLHTHLYGLCGTWNLFVCTFSSTLCVYVCVHTICNSMYVTRKTSFFRRISWLYCAAVDECWSGPMQTVCILSARLRFLCSFKRKNGGK